jgi:primosomal protein N' (replication factor Y)
MSSDQRNLFDTTPPPWEVDDQAQALIADVVFTEGPKEAFSYLVPEHLATELQPGQRVRVPLGRGNRPVEGYCVAVETRAVGQRRLKPVALVLDAEPLLSPALLKLSKWIAEHYLCAWGQVLETVLPAGVRGGSGTRAIPYVALTAEVRTRLGELKLPPKQKQIVDFLARHTEPIPLTALLSSTGSTRAPVQTLRTKGILEWSTRRQMAPRATDLHLPREEKLVLNADQQHAFATILAALESQSQRTILIHGVTGSGKTEVYLQAIAEVLSYGRQAIVLVPEISLTPQTEARFRARFGHVAVLHSHQTDVERHQHWQQIAHGNVRVVVGARSAIFAPTPHLGMIVLDEEHESSFKQGESPRYHARDVALQRAIAERIPLVLGSATPSLESYEHAKRGVFILVDMPRRVENRPLPGVGTIDLRMEFADRRSRGAISRVLHQAMDAALRDDGQVILLLNRRGFSTHIQCPSCGHVVKCPECSVALTHHLQEQITVCHYCDFRQPAPASCPECKFVGIRYAGLGTQKLESEVRARFPDYKCLRMDTDTMQKPGSHQRALSAFHNGEVRILLGTQMIAKGLDFPNVTLVGVINADTALHLPDFRAAERTFQLVTQVAGRTGRGPRGGRVLVQTFSPDHPAIVAATKHDYQMFVQAELPTRELLCYPPYAGMIRLVIRSPKESLAQSLSQQITERLKEQLAQKQIVARVLGPAPAPISKLRGKFRFQIQCQSVTPDALRFAVAAATADLNPPDDVEWIVDVDPVEML